MIPPAGEGTKATSILKKLRINEQDGEFRSEPKKQVQIIAEERRDSPDDRLYARNSRPNKLDGADEYFTSKQKLRVDLYVRSTAIISTGYFVISGAMSGIVMENSDDLFIASCSKKSGIM